MVARREMQSERVGGGVGFIYMFGWSVQFVWKLTDHQTLYYFCYNMVKILEWAANNAAIAIWTSSYKAL